MGAYDMIIGRDILSFLKIDIRFSDQLVMWEGSEMPFKPVKASVTTDYHIAESMAVEENTERIKKILDAKYSATDLEKVCSSQSHLEVKKQQKVLSLLRRFEDLFNGTLGKWNEEPVKLELQADATPYHARPFPIPRCHAETLKMEVDRLVEIGVLKKLTAQSGRLHRLSSPRKMVPSGSSMISGSSTRGLRGSLSLSRPSKTCY
jgi:hypothetical protein